MNGLEIAFVIFCITDFVLYAMSDFKVRTSKWWRFLPGSGFYAIYLSHLTPAEKLTPEPTGEETEPDHTGAV